MQNTMIYKTVNITQKLTIDQHTNPTLTNLTSIAITQMIPDDPCVRWQQLKLFFLFFLFYLILTYMLYEISISYKYTISYFVFVCLMVFNATFNNISVISWRSDFLGEETGGPRENHRPVTSHTDKLYPIMLYTSP